MWGSNKDPLLGHSYYMSFFVILDPWSIPVERGLPSSSFTHHAARRAPYAVLTTYELEATLADKLNHAWFDLIAQTF